MDETTNPETEVGTEVLPTESVDTDHETGSTDGTDTAEAVDDGEEVEIDGEKFKVPPKLKDAVLRHADYTRKTQEVAEQRRAVEQQQAAIEQHRAALQEMAQRQQANLGAYAQIAALDQRLTQFNAVNWQQAADNDPAGAQKAWIEYQQLRDQRTALSHHLSQQEQAATQSRQREIATSLEQGRQALAKEIQDWSPAVATQIKDYAKQAGFSEAQLAQVTDPRVVVLLRKAMLHDQQVAKAKTPTQTPKPAEPVKTIKTAGSGAATDPARMTDAEFAAMRRRQIAQRR